MSRIRGRSWPCGPLAGVSVLAAVAVAVAVAVAAPATAIVASPCGASGVL